MNKPVTGFCIMGKTHVSEALNTCELMRLERLSVIIS